MGIVTTQNDSELQVEARTTAQSIVSTDKVLEPAIFEHLKAMFWIHGSSHFDSSKLILSELEALNAKPELIGEFRRIFVGDH